MRKSIILFLAIMMFNFGFSRAVNTTAKVDKSIPSKLKLMEDPEEGSLLPSQFKPGKPTIHSSRNEFSSFLIDSSKNGYGPYSSTTNPIAVSKDRGIIAVYRQWQGVDATAGYIGAAQSETGSIWYTAQTLNLVYPGGTATAPNLPTGDGQPQGRYPSALASATGYPTPAWNEYTNGATGGGENGGRAMYTYDQMNLFGEFSDYVSPVYDLNNGCLTLPCDPSDLWVGNSWMFDSPTGPIVLSSYKSGIGGSDYFMLKSSRYINGYLLMDDAYLFASDLEQKSDGSLLWMDQRVSEPFFHINDNGVGYMVRSAYVDGYEDISNAPQYHSMFFKQTTDYGATWSNNGGFDNTGNYYIDDASIESMSDALYQEWMSNGDSSHITYNDTIYYSDPDTGYLAPGWFFGYDMDVRTDDNGGLHIATVTYPLVWFASVGPDSLYIETRFGGAGHYHLYNPDPINNPSGWTANLISDLSNAYYADWEGDMMLTAQYTDGTAAPTGAFFPQITLSDDEGSSVVWYASAIPSGYSWNNDTTMYIATDIDIFVAKSTDNGSSWSDPVNVTNTESGIFPNRAFETDVHLANIATDNNVWMFFQMPNFRVLIHDETDGFGGYMQRVYTAQYTDGTADLDSEMLPNQFTLKQNYPNPFNPNTQIEYSVNTPGLVQLDLFDIRGNHVKSLVNKEQTVGSFNVSLSGANLSSGVYFYTMVKDQQSMTRKMVLLK